MNNKFDELTKSMAQSVTRRAALKKFGLGAGMALMLLVAAVLLESRMAWRSDPAPASFVFTTVNVVADALNAKQERTRMRIRSFIGAGEAVETGQAWSGCPLTPLRTVRESFRSHGSRLYPGIHRNRLPSYRRPQASSDNKHGNGTDAFKTSTQICRVQPF